MATHTIVVAGTPPSVNSAYVIRTGQRGRAFRFPTRQAKEWITKVQRRCKEVYPELKCSDKKTIVNFAFIFDDNRKHDIDNLQKLTIDGLKGIAWNDDDQIVSMTSQKAKSIVRITIISWSYIDC